MDNYTPKQKAEMYADAADKLSDVVVELQKYAENEADTVSDEVAFVKTTANSLTNLVGGLKVKEKQATIDSESV